MNETNDISALMQQMGERAQTAARVLATASAERKHAALIGAAEAVWSRRGQILDANVQDMEFARTKGISDAMLNRLALDTGRIRSIVDGLRAVAEQADPVGAVLAEWDMPSGISIQRVRTPLGVIGVIYESRPNVTADAGALCLKSGNAVILRGGSESLHSCAALHECLVRGLQSAGLPETSIQLVPTRERAAVSEMLTMTSYIDVIVPRGGKGLVGLVQREARVPVFSHLEGIVHIYLDKDADPETALRIVLNSKTRRSEICGAAECLLIHEDIVPTIGQGVVRALLDAGVRVHGDEALQGIGGVTHADEDAWGREYLDMEISARVVTDQDAAMAHIARYGSQHTDCIITENAHAAAAFFNTVDSAIVMHNASTQFADGAEFGMGAEIGIATGKLHARGPVGADQLTSFKYKVRGGEKGAVRT